MRLYKRHHNWILFGLVVLLASCTTMGRISVQVSVPPPKAIPDEIQSIVLMNRSLTSEFSNLNQDSLESLFIRKKLGLDSVFLDSLAADTTLKVLGNSMYQSGRFDVVIPVKRNIPNNSAFSKDLLPPLTLEQTKQVCKEFDADALLVLESFSEKVNTSYQMESMGANIYIPDYHQYNIFVQVSFQSNWKLYQPKEKLLVAKFDIKDTIFWERSGKTLQETYEKLPLIKETLMSGAIENGQRFSEYISPGWKQENRRYFITKNTEADKAETLLRNNDWKEAENIWMKHSAATSANFRSKIEFNLALASEMNGDLKGAMEWAKKSYKSKFSKVAEDYIKLINRRIENN